VKQNVLKVVGHESASNGDGLTDEALMARYAKTGDDADFSILISRYEAEIYRYLVRYLGNKSLAEDVFQDTFLQIHQKRHMYEPGRAVKPWIYSIANHQAIDTLRRVGRHPTKSLSASANDEDGESMRNSLEMLLESAADGPLANLQADERRQWVQNSIAALPDTLRETLIMAFYQDLKYREIAEILHVPLGTVKSRLHSALLKLAEKARIDHISADDEG
jgi:RNA polymerase sigma-70 factor, ECF subfamily